MAPVLNFAFDAVLASLLILVAAQALAGDLFRGIVLFIVFGVLMALTWLRLGAPDVAIAEAAVGAGLTGVLLLDTLSRMRKRRSSHDETGDESRQ